MSVAVHGGGYISPARDNAGLRQAMLELFEEVRTRVQRKEMEQLAEMAENPEALLAGAAAKRRMAHGYYVWASHLAGLGRLIETKAIMNLAADEINGLAVLAEARQEYLEEHPACECGKLKPNRWAKTCGCGGARFVRREG